MITEFTCGIHRTIFNTKQCEKWQVFIDGTVRVLIDQDGSNMHIVDRMPPLTCDDLLEIAVLMNNIKRQYKQLQTN